MSKITAKFNRRMAKSFCVEDVTVDMMSPMCVSVPMYSSGHVEHFLEDSNHIKITLTCTGHLSTKNIHKLRLRKLIVNSNPPTIFAVEDSLLTSCDTSTKGHVLVFEAYQKQPKKRGRPKKVKYDPLVIADDSSWNYETPYDEDHRYCDKCGSEIPL